jgi:hypothetical protein
VVKRYKLFQHTARGRPQAPLSANFEFHEIRPRMFFPGTRVVCVCVCLCVWVAKDVVAGTFTNGGAITIVSTCMYVCMCVCVCVCMCVWFIKGVAGTFTIGGAITIVSICVCVCEYVSICVCMYICLVTGDLEMRGCSTCYTCSEYIHTYIHTHIHTHMHTYTGPAYDSYRCRKCGGAAYATHAANT